MIARCPSSQLDRPSHGLWSLWDMIKIGIERPLLAGMDMQAVEALFKLLEADDNASDGIAHKLIERPDEAPKMK